MWFKTRVSMVHVEGHSQTNVGEVYTIGGVDYRGILVHKPESWTSSRGVLKSFWGGRLDFPVGGKYTLAAFYDDENLEAAVNRCMGLIARAIENGEAVCDLSLEGTRDGWNNSGSRSTGPGSRAAGWPNTCYSRVEQMPEAYAALRRLRPAWRG